MISLNRKVALRRQAEATRRAAVVASTVGRTGQVAYSSVPVGDGDVSVGSAVQDAVDTSVVVDWHGEELEGSAGIESDVVNVLPDMSEISWEAEDVGQIAADGADWASELAGQLEVDLGEAIQVVAEAKATADGKNARRRGVTEPEPPAGGWAQGDQWVRDVLDDNDQPRPVEVLVWNGSEFVHEQTLTGELLVIGPNGSIRLADGVVAANSLMADAIDGMVITGATVRTAATGQRVQLDVNGLRTFNSNNVEQARLTAANGGLKIGLSTASIEMDAAVSYPTDARIAIKNAFGFNTELYTTDQFAGYVVEKGSATVGLSLITAANGTPLMGNLSTGTVPLYIRSMDGIYLTGPTEITGNTFATKSALNAWNPSDGATAFLSSDGRHYVRDSGVWRAIQARHITDNAAGRAYFGTGEDALGAGETFLTVNPASDSSTGAAWIHSDGSDVFRVYKNGDSRVYNDLIVNERILNTHSPYATATGVVSFPGDNANITTSVTVTFPAGRFTKTPEIVMTANTSVPERLNGPSFSAHSRDGFTGYLRRNNTGGTSATWIATQMEA